MDKHSDRGTVRGRKAKRELQRAYSKCLKKKRALISHRHFGRSRSARELTGSDANSIRGASGGRGKERLGQSRRDVAWQTHFFRLLHYRPKASRNWKLACIDRTTKQRSGGPLGMGRLGMAGQRTVDRQRKAAQVPVCVAGAA
jgi:hypothetical protein